MRATKKQRDRAYRLRKRARIGPADRQWLGRYSAGLRGELLEPPPKYRVRTIDADPATKADRDRASRLRRRASRLSKADREWLSRYYAERDAYAEGRDALRRAKREGRAWKPATPYEAAAEVAAAVAVQATGGAIRSASEQAVRGGRAAVEVRFEKTAPVEDTDRAELPAVAYSTTPYRYGVRAFLEGRPGKPGSIRNLRRTRRRDEGQWVTVAAITGSVEDLLSDVGYRIAQAAIAYQRAFVSAVSVVAI